MPTVGRPCLDDRAFQLGSTIAAAPTPRPTNGISTKLPDTKEVIRCLKRYVAREVFAVLNQMAAHPHPSRLISILDIYTSVEYEPAA